MLLSISLILIVGMSIGWLCHRPELQKAAEDMVKRPVRCFLR